MNYMRWDSNDNSCIAGYLEILQVVYSDPNRSIGECLLQCGTQTVDVLIKSATVKMLIDVNHLQLPGCSDKACCDCIILSIVLIKSGS